MNGRDSRHFVKRLSLLAVALVLLPALGGAMSCRPMHPLRPPEKTFHGQCPVCGMLRSMWARTWITFTPVDHVDQVCSFHCLADWMKRSGSVPESVELSVYHHPKRSIAADKAFVVAGSAAAGTMSPVSKIAFSQRSHADEFAAACGGEIVDFKRALAVARSGLAGENQAIDRKRLQKGKIVEPAPSDRCVVCNMVPARYPLGKCQIQTREHRTLHFCSTQCLFAFLGHQKVYADDPVEPFLTWVVDRNSGAWISGRAAYYVVGSSRVFGPMGYEAFPFSSRDEAVDFAAESGGRVLLFDEVAIDKIVPGWHYPAN